ncbi:hypothetical protein [Aliivibrio finisterrensis]|uniref:Conjugal transfer protein n=1 Tax=Aliivibrio finisterrensis TaxID=511998 RepID=A0ABY0I8G7_9GAMM|nr:hypothetical protein [Aliivibrio finisterrensis]RYU63811.1 hypothetical protein ERW53_12280 [Aliivibrio finisterrensis]RYU82748.1 hypothetical protein ERW52_14105 [Aliivibrio finisterrensis]
MPLAIPSLNAITSLISDQLSHHALGHCQLLTKSNICEYTVITTNGGCITAFEIIGMSRYLTDSTEEAYLSDVSKTLETIFRTPHRKIGIYLTRDPNRTATQLEDVFRSTQDSISRLGIEAKHFFEEQIKDLKSECSFERTILTVTTKSSISSRDSITIPTMVGESVNIDQMPTLAQNQFIETQSILQSHQAFCTSIQARLAEHITLEKQTSDRYLQIIKEEEELVALNQTKWRAKGIGDECDFALAENDEDFVTYPPLAWQLVTNDKERAYGDSSIIESNSNYIATVDREYFPITPEPFSKLLRSISSHIPLRCAYEFETGTEEIVTRLSAKKTWLMFFLFSKASRNIDSAINELTTYAEKGNGTLLGGALSVATWASTLDKAKEYKKEIIQALTSWGSSTVKTPDCTYAAYASSLPAFARKPSARNCVQPIDKHIITAPITRPAAPMATGGICSSSLDGRLFPIDPATSTQNYSLNIITGGMGAGKTVFSSIFNNTFIFGKGNSNLPLMGYLDFGSGVHNYISALRNWLPKEQHYKVELIQFLNQSGNAFNILEPQFGLDQLEEQERAFAGAFLCRVVNGTSSQSVHPKLADVMEAIISELFRTNQESPMPYTERLGVYSGQETRLHTEIQELLSSGHINISNTERKTWYLIRDKLYQLGDEYFSHARFCHRQGSACLTELMQLLTSSSTLRSRFATYKTPAGDSIIDYIIISLDTLLSRYSKIFAYQSQIDISQARVIGVNLKGITGNSSDAETVNTKKLFGMLGKYVAEKNFWREPKSFMPLVPPLYKEMYEKIIRLDTSMKKHSFGDEYKQYKSDEMDSLLDNSALIARKYGLCITISSQSVLHMPHETLKLATNLYILKMTNEDANYLAETYALSESFISEATRLVGMSNSSNFGRNMLYIGQFKSIKGYVVQILRNQITPSYLWNFASDAEDEMIKELAILRYGARDAYLRLAKLFPHGSALATIEARLKNSKFDSKRFTKEDIILELVGQLSEVSI